ncbi:Cysteine synthase B (EC 2.5.1.47) [uncultured Gammaproteobacteria bacterium]|jgi:cysteine synthase B|nr:Cysteine synthase B (EC 2.5.1.47) [uncultured Gammaproteobacteria bacterium]CAC9565777.1 Cysteine synthase B (EC 2.5.1.47) [uncultured Gammaproteobacteria bacterium]CAC9575804.1 Cysteine synthase B (EC 2.5.1.47) [uncultured Gammaproteobacteria bacterium]CAC9586890.1 Cysteine synthase B (EC 2.5.1.47) [uncultured Gammaproteobacteria bacterium]
MKYQTIEQTIGNTPLVKLQRLNPNPSNTILLKLEGNNPAGSVKDRAAFNMITQAEMRGEISTGDTLIEATSGNTGIALAMVAAIKGYKMVLIMPSNLSQERRDAMAAYGAELILVSEEKGMEGARDLADKMEKDGKGKQLDQFSNVDNSGAHINTTAEEIWQDTEGKITHFVSAMGTTGTIMGVSTTLKAKNSTVQIVGVQPEDGAKIAGIRRWPEAYLPKIFDASKVDLIMDVSQTAAEQTTRYLATKEGIFAGVSSGGAVSAAIELSKKVDNAIIVTVVCDRGDRYLSTGLFNKN